MLKLRPWTLIHKSSPDGVVIETVTGLPIDANAPRANASGPCVPSEDLVEAGRGAEFRLSADSNPAANSEIVASGGRGAGVNGVVARGDSVWTPFGVGSEERGATLIPVKSSATLMGRSLVTSMYFKAVASDVQPIWFFIMTVVAP